VIQLLYKSYYRDIHNCYNLGRSFGIFQKPSANANEVLSDNAVLNPEKNSAYFPAS